MKAEKYQEFIFYINNTMKIIELTIHAMFNSWIIIIKE